MCIDADLVKKVSLTGDPTRIQTLKGIVIVTSSCRAFAVFFLADEMGARHLGGGGGGGE